MGIERLTFHAHQELQDRVARLMKKHEEAEDEMMGTIKNLKMQLADKEAEVEVQKKKKDRFGKAGSTINLSFLC